MIGTSQLINAFGAPVCFTDTTDIFKDRSGVALYSLDYDASDAGGASGKFGEAAIFNGTSSSIVVPNNILSTNDHSISMWFNLNDTAGIQTAIEFDYENRIIFRPVSSDSNKANIGSSGWFNHGLSFSTGQWYHLVITFSAGNPFKIYINGVLSYTGGNSNINALSNDNIIGAGNSSGGNGLDGKIDQVRIFNTALTQSQVTQLYQENDSTVGTHLFGCIANYNLDGSAKESMGTTAYDGTETDITYRYDGTPTDVDFGVGGKSNYGARFNGSSSNIQINKFSEFTNYNFTLSVWIKTTDTSAYITSFRDPMYITLGTGLYTGGTHGMGIYDGSNSYFINNAAMQGINDGNWHHIVMTHDGTNLKGYIDGSLIGTVSTGTTTQFSGGTNYNRIGVRADGNTAAAYDGDIDQLRIFNKAISAAEVGKLYGNGAGEIACAYTSTTDNVAYPIANTAYYKLDNNSKDSARSTGKFNEGAIFNGSSSYIDLGASLMNNYESNNFSFSCWFNVPSTVINANPNIANNPINLSQNCIFTKADYISGAGLYGFIYGIENGEFAIAQGTSSYDGYSAKTSGASLSADTWHHVVITKTSSNVYNVYIDGSLQTLSVSSAPNGTFTTNANSRNAYIMYMAAATYSDPARYTEGKIDQVRIYDVALSSADVSNLYAETASDTNTLSFPSGQTAIATYQLDGDSNDVSGNYNGTDTDIKYAYDGTENNINYAFGRFGQAADFSGSVSLINTGYTRSGNEFAASMWVKAYDTGTRQYLIADFNSAGADTSFSFSCFIDTSDNINVKLGDGSSSQASIQTSFLSYYNKWTHIVLSIASDGKTPTLYLDNNQTTGTTVSNSYQTGQNPIGLGHWGGLSTSADEFTGLMDQVRIYDTALTSDQVTELYNEKQVLTLDTITEPTGNLRFDEFWASYDDGQINRAEFKSGGQIVDFNTYSEGHAVLNQNPQTSGKYYLEIQLLGIDATEAEFVGVFNRSSNTVYNSSGYFGKNPVDGNYGAGISHEGQYTRIGNATQTGFTDLSIGVNDIYCLAVDVDDKRIWFGRRDGLSDNSITWSRGNPNGLYGGLKVDFVPSDVIVAHISETYQRYAEFKVLDHADMLEPPFNFSYLNGAFTPSLTENESAH